MGLGEDNVDILDRLLEQAAEDAAPRPVDRASRAAQIEAFIAASGGDLG